MPRASKPSNFFAEICSFLTTTMRKPKSSRWFDQSFQGNNTLKACAAVFQFGFFFKNHYLSSFFFLVFFCDAAHLRLTTEDAARNDFNQCVVL